MESKAYNLEAIALKQLGNNLREAIFEVFDKSQEYGFGKSNLYFSIKQVVGHYMDDLTSYAVEKLGDYNGTITPTLNQEKFISIEDQSNLVDNVVEHIILLQPQSIQVIKKRYNNNTLYYQLRVHPIENQGLHHIIPPDLLPQYVTQGDIVVYNFMRKKH